MGEGDAPLENEWMNENTLKQFVMQTSRVCLLVDHMVSACRYYASATAW